ncbi:hypothetical protein [Halocynthiibacter namhaensis]|uniref:hypothetical protein n=1 Tax=Halocynthiibacter namhaensis TaxID=1290553 RepID=UPI0005797177|nr:hypothetical protein [Halocynthiibacter namhaensis]
MTLFRVISLVFAFWAQGVWAHSPYYTQTAPFQTESGRQFSIKLLYGDGVLGPDPVRAIVVDTEGQVHAVSPVATQFIIFCDGTVSGCGVYNGVSGEIHELAPEAWFAAMVVEDAGQPFNYPEDMDASYGFLTRDAIWGEILYYELYSIISYPLPGLIAIAWWSAIAALLVPMIWTLVGTKRRIRPLSVLAVLAVGARIITALALLFLTFVFYAFGPFSIYAAFIYATAAVALNLGWLLIRKRETQD